MPGPVRILALDVATRTGWACGAPGDRPAHGSIHLRDPGLAARACALRNWLEDAIAVHQPDLIVFEAPLVRGQHAGIAAGRLLLGLATVVEMVAYDLEVKCQEEHSGTTRKAVIGRGTFRKGESKPAVLAWCRSRGFDPCDDNAADALVLWHHAAQLYGGRAAA